MVDGAVSLFGGNCPVKQGTLNSKLELNSPKLRVTWENKAPTKVTLRAKSSWCY